MSPVNGRRLVFGAAAIFWIVVGVSCSHHAKAIDQDAVTRAKDSVIGLIGEVSTGSASLECSDTVATLSYLTDQPVSHLWVKDVQTQLDLFESECYSSLRQEQQSETEEKTLTARLMLTRLNEDL